MKVEQNISLKELNTFKIDAKAKFFVEIHSKEDFLLLLESKEFKNSNNRLFLGGGSNILLTKNFDGIVIVNKILGKKINGQNCHSINLTVGGGENRHDFVIRSCQNNYTGIENLALIPGSVGAAPIQNIGAYGMEAKDTIVKVGGINIQTKEYQTLGKKECKFDYRSSIFKTTLKSNFFITDVTFMLKKVDIDNSRQKKKGPTNNYKPKLEYGAIAKSIENIKENEITPLKIAEIISEIRTSKLPDRKKLGTAGSFFKNPIVTKEKFANLQLIDTTIIGNETNNNMIKLSAGQLIENCGLKGLKQGDVGTYEKHALVLVNYGNAQGSDVVQLANFIQKKVFDTYAVTIEPEVNYI